MPRYTAKVRAKRIELSYFKRLHAFRRWKLILTIAVPTVAAAWIVVAVVRGDQRIYNSGPVSVGHAMFGVDCVRCHAPAGAVRSGATAPSPRATASGFGLQVSDEACLSCHDGPAHNANQTFTPSCASCHVEHKGRVQVAEVADPRCTQCHANVQTKPGTQAVFERRIRSFPREHPEFAITVKEADGARRVRLSQGPEVRDTAQIKLNHEVHLKPDLQGVADLPAGPETKGVITTPTGARLTCAYCHQPDDTQAYMAPVRYARHCVACHALDFDLRVPKLTVPHDRPRIVRAFLRDFYATIGEECRAPAKARASADQRTLKECQGLGLVKGGGEEEPTPDAPRGRLGRRGEAEAEAEDRPRGRMGGRREEAPGRPADGAASAATQREDAEGVFKQRCAFCHNVTLTPGRLAEVAPTAIPVRWLPHSRFDHKSHRPLGCTECHRSVKSTATTDVLLPSIKTCGECHRGASAARSACVECHLYHDWARARDPNGPFQIRDLRPR